MITRIIVPDVGATGADVRLAGWLAKEGEFIAAGRPLFTLETDKATHDIEAFRAGYLRRIVMPIDALVEIGAVVALLSDALDEPLEERAAQLDRSDGREPIPQRLAGSPPQMPKKESRRILASPLARRLAGEQGLDLERVPGTGPEGQIHKCDVLKALAVGVAQQLGDTPLGRHVSLSPMRRAIARRTQANKSQIPHFYAEVTIDVTDALMLREQLRQQIQPGRTLPTINDLVVLAVAQSLRQVAELNASFRGEEIIYYDEVAVGVAIAVNGGVVVAVVRDADRFGLWTLALETARLRERAQANQLAAHELAGAALTVSNLGMYGLDRFTAVINSPEAAVLAIGAARPRPAVYEGVLAIRTLLDATLSLDHRVADGVAAARFLGELRQQLEQPGPLPIDPPTVPST